MFTNRTFQIFSIIAVVAVLIGACGGGTSESVESTTVPIPEAFEVPSYATTESALAEAAYRVENSQWYFYDETLAENVVEPGFLGVLVDESVVYRLIDNWDSGSNYGQSCMFDFGVDATEYSLEMKRLTFHVRATTLNQEFLKWCRSQMPSQAVVYTISATQSPDGFTIHTIQEDWDILPVFRIDD